MTVRIFTSLTFLSGAALLSAATSGGAAPTYSKDVAKILNNRCVECHRAGEIGPMAFTSYKEVRPWAKAIRASVATGKMPPWLADPHHGSFKNDRRLSEKEVATISAWAAAGAPEGNPADLPPLPKFETGWNIGKPDQVFDIGTDVEVPPEGTVAYKYFRVPTNFTEDKWIQAAEIRPDKREVVHHIIVFIQEPGAKGNAAANGEGGSLLVGWAPGDPAMVLEPGTARLVKAGSTLLFQVHYTTNGKSVKDRSYIGVKYASEVPKHRALTGRALNFGFRIPPGAPNHEVKASWTAKEDVDLVGLMPHMHVRGKAFKYTVIYPDGKEEVILNVPKYDFNWQLSYELAKPIHLPKGTRIDCVAHYDNSPNNPYNPDPAKEVRWGDQTWEEMMIGWFTYRVPVEAEQRASAE
jgi:mono/diheme cytochrome c family protein